MDALDLRGLSKIGCTVLHSKEGRYGTTIHLVHTSDGGSVAMLKSDVTELIEGRTTIHEIIRRDRAADMETPWPTVIGLDSKRRAGLELFPVSIVLTSLSALGFQFSAASAAES